MNIKNLYINKLWGYLQKLFKPVKEGALLRINQAAYTATKDALKNTIAQATNDDFSNPYALDEGSTNVRDNDGTGSGLIRKSFGSSLTAVRQVAEGQSKRSRTAREQDSKECRARFEADSNNTRSGLEQKISKRKNTDFFLTNFAPSSRSLRVGYEWATRRLRREWGKTRSHLEADLRGGRTRLEQRAKKGIRNAVKHQKDVLKQFLAATTSIPAPKQIRTLFYRKPSLHRFCTVFFPSLTREMDGAGTLQLRCRDRKVQNKVRTRLKQRTNQIQIAFVSFLLILMQKVVFKVTNSVPLVYGLFTGSVPILYLECTEKLLRRYQRATQASSSAEDLQAERRPAREHGWSCISQAYVVHMLSNGQAWIVRKTVPIDTLSMHYQRTIYASSILDPYWKSALSQISAFKRSILFYQASEWFWINNRSNRLKYFLNKKVGAIQDVLKTCRKDFLLKSKFSVSMIALLVMTFGKGAIQAQTKPSYTLQGMVSSAVDKKPLQAVSVRVEADQVKTSTNKDGTFSVAVSQRSGRVKLTSVGYKTVELDYTAGAPLHVQLTPLENQLDEVEVVSTGYQKIPKERATGSFEFVDNKLFNRKVSTDFVSRLEDVVPSISTNKTYAPSRGKLLGINIRGTSTMDWNVWPLVVIDGVPYQNNFDPLNGSFNNINPNDIENITVLKDAAASSIWGAQSGNGVIVITTKRGKYNQPFQLSVNSNVTIAQKPDLYYYPQMNTSDYIDLEKELFDKGYWNSRMNRYNVNLTPVIQLLKKNKEGSLDQVNLNQQLDALRGTDMREDFQKYIYRESVNQQYNVQLSGGSEKMNTSFSIGYDKNLANLVTSSYNRLTLKNNTQLRPMKNLTLDLGVTYTESKRKDAQTNMVGYNVMGRGTGNFPYMQLADAAGNALVVDAIARNPIFRDTVAGGRLLDAKYRPLDELNATHILSKIRETFLNFKTNYQFLPSLNASLQYAYQRAYQPTENWQGMASVHLREIINYRASWDKDKVTWNLPVGDYLNTAHNDNNTHQFRYQMDFNKNWNELHHVNAIAGIELRQIKSAVQNAVYWGYDPELLIHQPVQTGKQVPALNGIAGNTYLNDYSYLGAYTNRYTSYFSNASYTYNSRYVFSGSVRKDASNLFGVKANGRAQPFWSLGGAWLLSKENFINDQIFPLLKLRATYGYNGNVNNSTAAYPIISIQPSPDYITGQPYASMQSPPNPSLRWERVGMLNLGLDFSFKDRISGSVEYYIKRPKDLIAAAKVDPTTGYSSLNVNSANLDGRGVDISLNSVNIKSNHFNWTSNLVFAYNRTKVVKSYLTSTRAKDYITGPYGMVMTPIEDMQLYSLLTYKWAGLDPETGMPRGYVDGEISDDYGAIVNRGTISDLENHGSLQPVYFGSFRNNFSYKNLEISFNISYQLGHKFLRNSFNNRWFIDQGIGHSDYALRWQNPGDELHTDVPVFTYPNNLYASELYYYSSALVESASQIKLRDIQLSYSLNSLNRAGFKNVRLYAYIQNPGTLWRANKLGLDPEYGESIPDPMSISMGLNFNL